MITKALPGILSCVVLAIVPAWGAGCYLIMILPLILLLLGMITAANEIELAQGADPFILKWIAGRMKSATGRITLVPANETRKVRDITFSGASVASHYIYPVNDLPKNGNNPAFRI